MSLEPYREVITNMILEHKTHSDIAEHLSQLGAGRGYSVRSVRRFCASHGLRREVSDTHLEIAVSTAVQEAGPTYGRKMMTGYLAAKGIRASESRVGRALQTIHRPYHEMRCSGARNLNPIPYRAAYTGHKLHLDQNEKLGMFGVTHVLAIDGYSSKIMAYACMPVKNNLTIYEKVYRPAVINNGMWDQIRVDHGKEFFLTLFIQEILADHRLNTETPPYRQTQSTKEALVQLVDQELIDMDCNLTRYCVSNLICQLCHLGISRVVEAWNNHRIPGKGIPNQLAQGGSAKNISAALLPNGTEAADLYMDTLGSSLTRVSSFGMDPFTSEHEKATVEQLFSEKWPDIAVLLNNAVNKNFLPFKEALITLVTLTQRYS
ncbi:uncharacterized protein LOC130565818 isoform X2 [Triplophysa rosa]|uniref:uncharacterized protein LOC130565818 isoform X2 n=2 Tax=Triplophysa rosa TaxID=992332 RepID=UPI0025461125|nr:uncharacterized protein LOC130565818 isoform X2 [Triplophysa rosa]